MPLPAAVTVILYFPFGVRFLMVTFPFLATLMYFDAEDLYVTFPYALVTLIVKVLTFFFIAEALIF